MWSAHVAGPRVLPRYASPSDTGACRRLFLSTLPTMPTRISIPLELQEQVIDSLTNDKSALQQCALTCRAWVPRARLQLFRNITLRTRHDVYRLANAFDSGDGLEKLICELSIAPGDGPFFLETASAVLSSKLPNLRQLTLGPSDSFRTELLHLSCHTRWYLSQIVSLRCLVLRDVVLRSFNECLGFIYGLSELSSLTLYNISWFTHGVLSPTRSRKKGHMALSTLRVGLHSVLQYPHING